MKRKPKICPKCGKEFLFEGRSYRRKYCSFKCSNAHHDFKKMGRLGGLVRNENTKKRGYYGTRNRIIDEKERNRLRIISSKGGIASAIKQAKTNRSRGENHLAKLLKKDGFNVLQSNWAIVPNYEIDIWLPQKRVAISYNGMVHYKPIYGEKRLIQVRCRDQYRDRKLKELGIQHIIVREIGRFSEENVRANYLLLKEKLKFAS